MRSPQVYGLKYRRDCSMSLQVWLPLTKDLRQQGLSNTIATNHGTTYQSIGGKLGGCYYFSGSTSSYISTDYQTNIGTSDFSISLWIKIPTMTSGSYYAICTSKTTGATSTGFGIYWNYSQKKFLWSTADGSTATEIWMANTVDTIVYDKWIHLVMVRNSNDAKKGYFYIDGVRYELASVPAIRNITTASNLYLGMCTNSSYAAKMYLNDFRIYDHALSQMEVKELAKGLILHYPLNRQGWGQENLLKYTKVNATNQNLLKTNVTSSWNNLTLTTKDGYDCYLYPSAQSSTWFASGSWYSGMKANTTYTYTAWIYFTANASFTFTSLGHFQVYNSASTASDKAHEDVVSARIYQPSTIPANKWTKVRITFTTNDLANSYFVIYPRYNVAANTGDLYFRDCKLEESAVPTPWCPNSIDNEYSIMGLNSTTEYDCSGFCNNGTRTGTFTWTSDTPKYTVSTKFNGAEVIVVPFTCGSISEAVTVACWGYESNWNVSTAERLLGAATSSSGWCIGDYGSENTLFAFYANGGYNAATGFKQLSTGWHHFVITFDGLNLIYYIDGQQFSKKTFSTKQVATGNYNINIGRHYGGGYNFKGNMSDIRIYATALSADDVKSLYQNSAYIDSSGNVYGAVHSEV